MRDALALFFAVSLSVPAHARPELPSFASSTGLHANDVEPLLRGLAAQGLQVALYATCFLALDDDETCLDISGRALEVLEAS